MCHPRCQDPGEYPNLLNTLALALCKVDFGITDGQLTALMLKSTVFIDMIILLIGCLVTKEKEE